jgi:hypothetical protein
MGAVEPVLPSAKTGGSLAGFQESAHGGAEENSEDEQSLAEFHDAEDVGESEPNEDEVEGIAEFDQADAGEGDVKPEDGAARKVAILRVNKDRLREVANRGFQGYSASIQSANGFAGNGPLSGTYGHHDAFGVMGPTPLVGHEGQLFMPKHWPVQQTSAPPASQAYSMRPVYHHHDPLALETEMSPSPVVAPQPSHPFGNPAGGYITGGSCSSLDTQGETGEERF